MRKLYPKFLFALFFTIALSQTASSQSCDSLTATFTTYESRCAATGSIKINATGGSGNYKYKMDGPSVSNYTTTDSITGLSAGTYTLTINDVINNCTKVITGIIVAGNYQDPRFTLLKQDVTCDNGNNGSITVDGLLYGLAPYSFSIVAPSPMGVGTTNSTGVFPGLIAGNYSIRLTDSCGGIQTRQVTVGNYSWWIDSYSFTKTGCDEATGWIKVKDSRGNISTASGIPGFTYGVVRAAGDTVWSNDPFFSFALAGHNTFDVIVKDNCGLIKKVSVTVTLLPTVQAAVNISDRLCNTFSAWLEVTNFFNPDFCLYNQSDVLITCNLTGTFINLPYGTYCIKVHDACTDTTITRCFTAAPPPITVGNDVPIRDKTCTAFTASVTGQSGLTNPDYCLYTAAGSLISCNTTGTFTDIPYGSYCIRTHDNCRDTIITRCFEVKPPTPVMPDVIVPAYITCNVFGIIVAGDSVTAPIYCLVDTSGVVIMCNGTGIFDSIPLGNYCVTMHDACTDTTITRCFGVDGPTVNNDMVTTITNKTCSAFSVRVSSNNFISPYYCLYNNAGDLVACDSSGIFNNLPYGNYCIKARLMCPDTTLTICFPVTRPIPAYSGGIILNNPTCTTFSAAITGLANFTDPEFCLYSSANVLIECNGSGSFGPLPYGQYCIRIKDNCYDTTITKCFTKSPAIVSLSGSSARSCTLGFAKFNLSMGGGNLPVNVKVFNTDGSLLLDTTANSNNINIDNIPALPIGNYYQIIATDNCGNKDTLMLGAPASYFNHSPAVIAKCPGSSWANGSGDIAITVSTNLGALTVRIVKKDGVAYPTPLVPNSVTGNVFRFNDLGPGTYVLSSSENGCNKKFMDTIRILPYQFPNLSRSSAYQCDEGGFSVSAIAQGGVPPFTYEIIGSIPAFPSIISGPQSSPVFNISNGTTYSLIRLRALDACGNATLGDASILPLAMSGIHVSANCFTQPSMLSVDPIFNAVYSWYKKSSPISADSTYLGSGPSYFIPEVTMPEVGFYYCYISVNDGCIKRGFVYNVTGLCFIVLPVKLEEFKGKKMNSHNLLSWKASQENGLANYTLERKDPNGNFVAIGETSVSSTPGDSHAYSFSDEQPLKGKNHYRLKMENKDGTFNYSNIIMLENDGQQMVFSIYPNPVKDVLTISFDATGKHQYEISVVSITGQVLSTQRITTDGSSKLQISRALSVMKGIYLVKITEVNTKTVFTEKVVFL